jgi:predicted transcriptional regulator
VLTGQSLTRFVAARKKAVAACEAHPDTKAAATAKLDFVATEVGQWAINRADTPSLPHRPPFYPQPGNGKSYSQIPIPAKHREACGGRKQRTKKWSGNGVTAWCHYLAQIDAQVAYFGDPPEAATLAALGPFGENDLDNLDALKGRSDAAIEEVAEYLFKSSVVAGRLSHDRLAAIRNGWDYALDYFTDNHRERIDTLDLNALVGYRNYCADMIRMSERSTRTVNGYLGAARRVLGWIRVYCQIDLPAFTEILTNFTRLETANLAKQEGSSPGTKEFGCAEMVAMSVPALRKWFRGVADDPFELALTLCSLNLAAGASDLSDLRFLDDSVQRHQPAVDITRKLFITYRSKSRVARWTKILQNTNEHAIDMMPRTHAALKAWIRHREKLIDDLRKRADIPASIKQAKAARRLRERGRTLAQIAEELSVPKWKVADLLRRPTDRRGWARSLVQQGYSVKDTAGLTGLSVGSVSNYTRDIPRDKTPRGNRRRIVMPDPNCVFFVPNTGLPLTDRRKHKNFVRDLFDRVCDRAGIAREKDGDKDRSRASADGFVLPKGNGHYIFRRTAATVAGILGGVSESALQHFLGHKNPEMTR